MIVTVVMVLVSVKMMASVVVMMAIMVTLIKRLLRTNLQFILISSVTVASRTYSGTHTHLPDFIEHNLVNQRNKVSPKLA